MLTKKKKKKSRSNHWNRFVGMKFIQERVPTIMEQNINRYATRYLKIKKCVIKNDPHHFKMG